MLYVGICPPELCIGEKQRRIIKKTCFKPFLFFYLFPLVFFPCRIANMRWYTGWSEHIRIFMSDYKCFRVVACIYFVQKFEIILKKRPVFLHVCTTRSELPSNISIMMHYCEEECYSNIEFSLADNVIKSDILTQWHSMT